MEFNSDIHALQCPKCHHGMDEISHEGITVDRCTHCQGLWFDDDEAHHLKDIKGSAGLDIGSSKEGVKWDSRVNIACPRCNKPMEKAADPKQVHIWYEICEDHGMFMDAGEFKDFIHESPLDCFRGLIKGNRETTAP